MKILEKPLPQDYLASKSDQELITIEKSLAQENPFYLISSGYLYIKTKSAQLIKLELNSIQKRIVHFVIALLKAKGMLRMWVLKARQMGLCLDPNTRILTSDLKWIKIKDATIGQKIVAVDEKVIERKERRTKEGVIERVRTVEKEAFEITMEDGRTLIATKEHRFLYKKNNHSRTYWKTVGSFKIGDAIRHITTVWGEPNYEDGWFGGMIDGEGSVRKKNRAGCEMSVSQRPGIVLDRARKYLYDNGYKFREEIDNRLSIPNGGKFSNNPVGRLILGRMDELFRLIGKTRPSKALVNGWWKNKCLPGRSKGCEAWVKIISIKPLGKRKMVDLQTSTKTFIAEGLVSHNSTLIEAIIYSFTSQCENTNSCVIADDLDGSNYIFEMQKLFQEKLIEGRPYLVPVLKRSNEKKIEFDSIHSQVLIDTSENENAGRKFTFRTVHLSECAFFQKSLKTLMIGLSQSVPNLPGTMIFGETTGNGMGGDFYEIWEETEKLSKKKATEWVPLFLPWFIMDEYSMPLDKTYGKLYSLEGIHFGNNEEKIQFLNEEKRYQSEGIDYEFPAIENGEIVWKRETYRLTDAQLNWRRYVIVNDCNGDWMQFRAEYPATSKEAFVASGDIYFDRRGLEKQKIRQKKMIGNLVEENGKMVFRADSFGKFTFYQLPSTHTQAVIGGDASEGIIRQDGEPGDKAAAVVLDKFSNRTLATYNQLIDPDTFGYDLIKLGRFYNKALIACENKNYGTEVNRILYRNYGNVFKHIKEQKGVTEQTDMIGFNTNSVTRPQMLAQMNAEIRENSTELIDEELINQCWKFIRNSKKNGKPEAIEGGNDDLVVSRAIAGFVRRLKPYSSPKKEQTVSSNQTKPNGGISF